jgi:16S rRNA (adenine1518-N6/adenine1519-N6)-dimethyltransferase
MCTSGEAGGVSSGAPRIDYDSPVALRAFLEGAGLAMSKRFGQNFLVSRQARERVLAELSLGAEKGKGAREGEPVWEIGPGIGAMTAMILDAGFELSAFEIDHGFVRVLERSFGERSNFRLHVGDFLDTWEAGDRPAAILGNLPYNAAASIIAAIIEGFDLPLAEGGPTGGLPRRMVFTVQKEAAQRMAAKPGTKDYAAFSVLCGAACKVRLAFDLGAGSFWPPPKVTSTVVVMEPRQDPILPGERRAFSSFVRATFASRRKTLKNNLKAVGRTEEEILAGLSAIGAVPEIRAEALAPGELAALFKAMKPLLSSPAD